MELPQGKHSKALTADESDQQKSFGEDSNGKNGECQSSIYEIVDFVVDSKESNTDQLAKSETSVEVKEEQVDEEVHQCREHDAILKAGIYIRIYSLYIMKIL